jgi:hypothetical protein
MEKNPKVEIIETQQESEIDDETVFTLFIDGKVMSWAKTTLYSNLEDIRTARLEKRRGYGRLLLTSIEENARCHRLASMNTSDFNVCNVEATGFFKDMFYTISSVSCLDTSMKASKIFQPEPQIIERNR